MRLGQPVRLLMPPETCRKALGIKSLHVQLVQWLHIIIWNRKSFFDTSNLSGSLIRTRKYWCNGAVSRIKVPKMIPKALGRSLEPSCRNVNMRNGNMWRMVAASQGSWLPKTKDVQKCGDPNVGAMGVKSCTEPWSARRHRGVPAEARLDMARPLQSAKALKKHHD